MTKVFGILKERRGNKKHKLQNKNPRLERERPHLRTTHAPPGRRTGGTAAAATTRVPGGSGRGRVRPQAQTSMGKPPPANTAVSLVFPLPCTPSGRQTNGQPCCTAAAGSLIAEPGRPGSPWAGSWTPERTRRWRRTGCCAAGTCSRGRPCLPGVPGLLRRLDQCRGA